MFPFTVLLGNSRNLFHFVVQLFVLSVGSFCLQLLALLPLRLLPVPRARHELQLLQPLPLRMAQRRVQASKTGYKVSHLQSGLMLRYSHYPSA